MLLPAGSAQAGGNERDEAASAAEAASRTVAIVSTAYLRSAQSLGVREAMAVADPAGSQQAAHPGSGGRYPRGGAVRRPDGP